MVAYSFAALLLGEKVKTLVLIEPNPFNLLKQARCGVANAHRVLDGHGRIVPGGAAAGAAAGGDGIHAHEDVVLPRVHRPQPPLKPVTLDPRHRADTLGHAAGDRLLANEFAPEHFCLLTRDPESLVPRVQNAGGIFVGEDSPEVLGDYVAGPSHVMPTGGSARFASPLSVMDFLKVVSTIALTADDLRTIGPAAAMLARAEGLTAHARSIELRLEGR